VLLLSLSVYAGPAMVHSSREEPEAAEKADNISSELFLRLLGRLEENLMKQGSTQHVLNEICVETIRKGAGRAGTPDHFRERFLAGTQNSLQIDCLEFRRVVER